MNRNFWESKYSALATYNGEVSRGLVHTEEYREKMKALQAEYDAKTAGYCEREGLKVFSF